MSNPHTGSYGYPSMRLNNVHRDILIDAVCGREVPQPYAELWVRAGLCFEIDGKDPLHRLAYFIRSALAKLTHDELAQLYCETHQRQD